jgi:hypothetical protein
MKALKYVCRRAAIFIERLQVIPPLGAIDDTAFRLNGRNGVTPPALKLHATRPSKEGGSIPTASKPMFLLPSQKARGPKCNLLNNRIGNNGRFGVPAHASGIRKLSIELNMR